MTAHRHWLDVALQASHAAAPTIRYESVGSDCERVDRQGGRRSGRHGLRETVDAVRAGSDEGRNPGADILRVLAVVLAVTLLNAPVARGQTNPIETFYDLVNQQRISEGYAPLGRSRLLDQAAQRHAEDLVTLDSATHEGSDGSDYRQRIREARYQAWDDGLMVNEALWVGLGTAEDAVTWFHSNPAWEVFVDSRYREIGIGYANDNGVHYFVVTFGSRPGVLPIFINDGAPATDSPQVALRLTNEEAEPLGEGSWMGKAIEVRVSNTPDFEDKAWQPWEPLLPWMLASDEPGDYPVYVEFRDGAGRTAVAEDTIELVEPESFQPTPSTPLNLPTSTPPPTPVAEETPETPPASPTATPDTPQPPATESPVTPAPAQTYTPLPTWTPLPDAGIIEPEETTPMDWPVLLAFLFQGLAVILGVAAFLRRR